MHVIAQPVHWRLNDFAIPRVTGRATRGAAGLVGWHDGLIEDGIKGRRTGWLYSAEQRRMRDQS
jgi:hypothetical protein